MSSTVLAAEVTLSSDALNTLNLAVSFLLPLVVGAVTRQVTRSSVKQAALAVLCILTGAATTVLEAGGTFDVQEVLLGAVASYVTAQTGYTLVLKPGGIAKAVAVATDKAGIGATVATDPPAELMPPAEPAAPAVDSPAAGTVVLQVTAPASDQLGAAEAIVETLQLEQVDGPAGLFDAPELDGDALA